MPRRKTKTSFKKGNKAGKGRPKSAHKIEVENIDWGAFTKNTFDRDMLNRYISVINDMGEDEVRARLNDPKVRMIEKVICRFWLKAMHGDVAALNLLLERSVGKVKTEIEMTKISKYDGWTPEQLEAHRRMLNERNRETIERLEKRRELQAAQAQNVIDITPTEAKDVTPPNETTAIGKPILTGSD